MCKSNKYLTDHFGNKICILNLTSNKTQQGFTIVIIAMSFSTYSYFIESYFQQHGYETCRYFCCPIYRLQLRGNAHCVKLEDFTETVLYISTFHNKLQVEITLNVQGNIMCPKPFDVRVNIWVN